MGTIARLVWKRGHDELIQAAALLVQAEPSVKLAIVGDAAMHPAELLEPNGNIDPRRDLMILEGPMDDLDHAALRHRYGGKLGVDATEKSALDDVAQPWPEEITMTDEMRKRVTRRWKEYGL